MAHSLRVLIALSFASGVASSLRAAEDPALAQKPPASPGATHAPAEYQRVGIDAYPKAALLQARPGAIVIPKGQYDEHDGAYWFTPKVRAPKELFFETSSDWIEPITPPDMPSSLGIAPDAMQIREPHGDVQVALPSAPGNFSPATDAMSLPNGAVVKTGADSTTAVLIGGVDSVRLMPGSSAAVQQTVTANARSVEVDLTTGGVFSKVGTQIGVAGGYEVHTPAGRVASTGGDFATIIAADRTDVWVAAGTVSLDDAIGNKAGKVTAKGAGLELLRSAPVGDPKETLRADVETLSAAINFIALANQKVKGLRDKLAQGEPLTANQQAYLARIRQVPYLIMLDLVAHAPAPALAETPAAPAKPIKITVHKDGQVHLHGATITLAALQAKLADIAKATPGQPFVVGAGSDVPPDKVQAVQDALKAANFQNITLHFTPAPPPIISAAPALRTPAVEPPPLKPLVTAPTLSATNRLIPLEIDLHAHGKIALEGEPVTLDVLKIKLAAVASAIPNQPIILRKDDQATTADARKILALCRDLKLPARSIKVATAPPLETASEPNPLAPGLRMDPAMQISSDPTPAPTPASPAKPEASTSSP